MTIQPGTDAPPGSWCHGSDVPLHGRNDPFDDTPAACDEYPGWCDRGREVPPDPGWALDASQQVLAERLAAAASDPAGADTASVVEALTPDGTAGHALTGEVLGAAGLGAAGLVAGVVATQRLVNHFQAVQQRWLAALARPGVAVPLPDLVDACQHPGRRVPGSLRAPDRLPDGLPPGEDGQPDLRPLLTHPAWRAALADTAARLASAEVGCALHLAPITARIRTEQALGMIDALPATHAAQHAGDVDAYRASIIADRTTPLTPQQRRVVERQVLTGATTHTPAALRDHVDASVIAIDPDAAARRVSHAKQNRGVRVDKDVDDMAVFRALLGCDDAQLAYGVLDQAATALTAAGLADGRGSSQLRADVFNDLFRALHNTGHADLSAPHPDTATTDPDGHPEPAGHASTRPDDSSDNDTAGGTAEADEAGNDTTGSTAEADHADETGNDTNPRDLHKPGTTERAGSPAPAGSAGRVGTVAGYRRRTTLNVYINASTLAGQDDLPAELAGHGVITADTARALAASADTVRALIARPIITTSDDTAANTLAEGLYPYPARPEGAHGHGHSGNPARGRVCGTGLDAGRQVYRPPEATMDYVTARDRTCTWPGCRAPARRCDADHRRPYAHGGATCPCNLDLLCRFHHQVRTFTAWHARPGPDGNLIWTSPTGNTYPTRTNHPLLEPLDDEDPPPF